MLQFSSEGSAIKYISLTNYHFHRTFIHWIPFDLDFHKAWKRGGYYPRCIDEETEAFQEHSPRKGKEHFLPGIQPPYFLFLTDLKASLSLLIHLQVCEVYPGPGSLKMGLGRIKASALDLSLSGLCWSWLLLPHENVSVFRNFASRLTCC